MRALIAVVMVVASGAMAKAPAVTDPDLRSWFEGLHQPSDEYGNPGMSCCDTADGHILADDHWRVAGDTYEVLIDGEWVKVDQRVVLNGVDNPTGQMVAFFSPHSNVVYCLVRPAAG